MLRVGASLFPLGALDFPWKLRLWILTLSFFCQIVMDSNPASSFSPYVICPMPTHQESCSSLKPQAELHNPNRTPYPEMSTSKLACGMPSNRSCQTKDSQSMSNQVLSCRSGSKDLAKVRFQVANSLKHKSMSPSRPTIPTSKIEPILFFHWRLPECTTSSAGPQGPPKIGKSSIHRRVDMVEQLKTSAFIQTLLPAPRSLWGSWT